MALVIYNCHSDGDEWRITKFTDGNPESSYLCTHSECQCPAGHRDTCRHRQMLPEMIDRGLVNSHLFLNWDHPARPTCQFDGMIDPVPAVFANDYPVVPEGQHVEEDTSPALCDDEGCPQHGTDHVCITRVAPAEVAKWRRI